MILEKKDGVCAFKIDTISGETFFLDAPSVDLANDYLELPIETLALVTMPPTPESGNKPTNGLLKIREYKSLTNSMYIGKLGVASISQVDSDSPIGKAVIGARSGIILG